MSQYASPWCSSEIFRSFNVVVFFKHPPLYFHIIASTWVRENPAMLPESTWHVTSSDPWSFLCRLPWRIMAIHHFFSLLCTHTVTQWQKTCITHIPLSLEAVYIPLVQSDTTMSHIVLQMMSPITPWFILLLIIIIINFFCLTVKQ